MSRALMMMCLVGALVALAKSQEGPPEGPPEEAPSRPLESSDYEEHRRIIEEQFCLKLDHVTGVTCSRDCSIGGCSIKLHQTDTNGIAVINTSLCDGVDPVSSTTFIAKAACFVKDLEGNIISPSSLADLVCDIEIDVTYSGAPAKAYFPTIIPGLKIHLEKVIPGAGEEQPAPEVGAPRRREPSRHSHGFGWWGRRH